MTNDLLLSSDRGCISLLELLDLSAAFDTIDHNILLNRLENSVGISGSALAWFKSYLSDRHQFVAVNEEVLYRSQVQYGVPQGSVLGPLTFNALHVTRGGKSTKIFYSSKSTITLLKFYLSTSKSTSLKIYSSKSKK